MKNLLFILIIISAISCTRSVDAPGAGFFSPGNPGTVAPPNQFDDSLTRNLGNGVILKISLEPTLVCDAADSSKPCTTFVNIICTLSKPINKYVQVEVIYTNVVEENKNTSGTAQSEKAITIMLAPNTTELVFTSNIQVSPNAKIGQDQFRIGTVTVFDKVD